ncbi:MAG: sialidase family protein [Chthoniobacteraceae bacterium]|jgi:photosystem II stability/assembly factor-like uncharacterized protein
MRTTPLFLFAAFIGIQAPAAGPLRWIGISGTSEAASEDVGYLLMSDSNTTITLPASPKVGAIVRLAGVGAGNWSAVANAGQSIQANLIGTYGPALLGSGTISPVVAIAASRDGSKLLVSVGNGTLYISSDGGATWQVTLNLGSDGGPPYIASSWDGTFLFANPAIGGMYTSTNSGATWNTNAGLATVGGPVACSSDGLKTAQVYGGIPVPTTGGYLAAVTASGGSSPAGFWTCLASSTSGASLIAGERLMTPLGIVSGTSVITGSAIGQIYTTSDYGATWTAHGPNQNWTSVAISADGTKLAAVGASGPIYTSPDSGNTWTTHQSSANWTSVTCSTDGTELAAAAANLVYVSCDSGVTWAPTGILGGVVRCTPDGSKLIVGNGNQITVEPFPNPDGKSGNTFTAVIGPQLSSIELIYVGTGRWQMLSHEGPLSFQ